jgi:tRNA A-37 threonylcarbamoyl transferase component Bud32
MALHTRITCAIASPLPEKLVAQIPSVFTKQGKILYNQRNQIRVFNINGEEINVKKYCIPSIFNRLIYSAGIRMPKAQRAFENMEKLLKIGISTPNPYAYIIEKENGILGFSYLISRQIDGKTIGYDSHSKALISQLAHFTADMHQKGALHRDYTPNNILLSEKEGHYAFSLVDTNQCVFSEKPIPVWRALPYLIQLFLKNKEFSYFVAEYARFRGADPQRCCRTAKRLRHIRTCYSKLKKWLKKIPGSRLITAKRLDKTS